MGIESMLMGKYKKQIDKGTELARGLLFDEIEAEKALIYAARYEMEQAEDGEREQLWKNVYSSHVKVYKDLLEIRNETNLGEEE